MIGDDEAATEDLPWKHGADRRRETHRFVNAGSEIETAGQ
jgi:hypothetical protein